MQKKTIFTGLFWALLLATTFLLLIEVKPVPQTWPKDKLEHAAIFALLTYFAAQALTRIQQKHLIYICICLAIYGVVMEALQSSFTLTRTGSMGDWLADLVGIAIGYFVLNLSKISKIR